MPITPHPIALVTGANRGIGKEIAEQLERRGCTVLRTYRNIDSLPADKRKFGIQLEVTDSKSIALCAAKVQEEFCRLDILINNAGVVLDRNESIESLDIDVFRQTLEVNTLGVFAVSQALLPALKASSSGRIINISSGAGQLKDMFEWAPAYAISKTALNALTVQQSIALRKYGISVNCVRPGWVRTDMGGADAPLSVEEGADTAVWLALDADPNETGKFWFERKPTHW